MHTSRSAVAGAMPSKINTKFSIALTLTLTLGAMLIVFSAGRAQASSNAEFTTEIVKKNKARKPKPDKGYGETVAERDRRLLRECKGRPNAGACEGYAH